ncbi:MAG: DUF4190 domain-containing protein [Acidimicrobiales bacterium]|nr:DUF4190 domain-containing protein [Acidimicrobiales bacterium]
MTDAPQPPGDRADEPTDEPSRPDEVPGADDADRPDEVIAPEANGPEGADTTSWAQRATRALTEGSVAPAPAEGARTEPKAIAALALGMVGFFLFAIVLGPLAIFFAWRAKRDIQASEGRLKGMGLAVAGQILGFVAIGFWIIFLITNA